MSTTLYTASATATSGRDGRVYLADKTIEHKLAVPRSMGGPGGEGTNPEQLFAMGYSACFGSALKLVAGMAHQKTADIVIDARVHFQKQDDGGFGIAAELDAHMPSIPRALAEELLAKAHQVCPYSKATRGNIDVKLAVVESLP